MRTVSRNWLGGLRILSAVALAAVWGCAAGDDTTSEAGIGTSELDGPSASVECKNRPGQQKQPKKQHHRGHKGKDKDEGHSGNGNSGQGGAAAIGGAPTTGTSTSTNATGSGGASNGNGSSSWVRGGATGYAGAAGAYFQQNCGDGALDAYEGCDDGNKLNGDGCSDACSVELGWNCSTGTCAPVACGNGMLECDANGNCESCEDGNTLDGDGCNAACQIEVGWDCWGNTCVQAVCGNQNNECALGSDGEYHCEDCDDGNALSGDGCSSTCLTEPNWTCNVDGCHQVSCGDKRTECSSRAQGEWVCEACDDGNRISGDGCDSSCLVMEPGWSCGWEGGACTRIACGNGTLECGYDMKGLYNCESCDDGNTTAGDGCSGSCQVEYGGFGGSAGYPSTSPVGGRTSIGSSGFPTPTAGQPTKVSAGGTSGK